MKIKSIIIENFRGYKDRQIIDLNDFTAFVGRNDAGKSTILEALDIFFNDNKGIIEIDAADINKQAHCCPEKFYHSVSCLGPLPSGTLAVRSV